MNTDPIYEADGKISVCKAVPFGLQHVLAMFVANIAPILIVTGVVKIPASEAGTIVQAAMIIAGIGSLLQMYPFFRLGSGLPVIMGISFTFVSVFCVIGLKYGYGAILGAVLVGGVLEGILGLGAAWWRKLVPPIVSATVVTAIGFSLLPIGANSFGGGFGHPEFGDARFLIVGTITLVSCLIFNIRAKSFYKQLSVLFGLFTGYIAAYFYGMVDLSRLTEVSLVSLPAFMPYPLEFHYDAMFSVFLIFLVSATETLGDTSALAAMGFNREAKDREISGSIAVDGFVSAASSLFGCMPITSFSQNVGLIAMTRVVNRKAIASGAVIMVLAGLVPALGVILASLPEAVLGGCTLMMFGSIVISYLSPPFIGAYAWIQMLGRQGVITQFLNDTFGLHYGGVYGFAGIVLVFTLQSFPLVYIYVSGALKNLDNSLSEAAESLGCSRMGRIWKIIVPLVMPTLLASSMLVFMRVFADFGTPMLIGEGYKTLPVLIYNQFMGEVSGDDGFAAAICCIVIGLTIVMFFVQRFLAGRNTYAMTALKPMAAESLGGLRNILAHLAVYMVVGLAILPQFVVVYTSFLATNGGQVFTGGFALQSYDATLFAKDNDVIWHTYFLGLCAIAAVLVLGVLIAYLSVRKRNTLNSILDVITMFPFIIPGSVLGIAFVFAFNKSPIILTGTALIMIISFAVRRMPYTVRSSTAILGNISPSIEEAAISLGASDMTTFRKITVPMMMPGVLSGAIMSWVTIISELSSSIILYTNSTQTLTVSIYTEVIRGNYGNASAYATILTVTSILSLLLFYKVTGRRDVSV